MSLSPGTSLPLYFFSCQDHFELASQSSRALCIVHTKSRVSCFPNPVTTELDVTTLYPSRSRAFRICQDGRENSTSLSPVSKVSGWSDTFSASSRISWWFNPCTETHHLTAFSLTQT